MRRTPATSIWYLRVDCDGCPTFDRLGDLAVGRSSSFVDQRGGCRCDVRGVNAGGGQELARHRGPPAASCGSPGRRVAKIEWGKLPLPSAGTFAAWPASTEGT